MRAIAIHNTEKAINVKLGRRDIGIILHNIIANDLAGNTVGCQPSRIKHKFTGAIPHINIVVVARILTDLHSNTSAIGNTDSVVYDGQFVSAITVDSHPVSID